MTNLIFFLFYIYIYIGVAALLVLFSRNHNYICQQLLEKNENGRFSYGPGKPLATEKDLDEELFQTARLVNNAW